MMNSHSRETLRRVTQNDPSLTSLSIAGNNYYGVADGKFYSDSSVDYSRLGAAIANNTNLEEMVVRLSDDRPDNTHLDRLEVTLSNRLLGVSDRGFYDGLKRNSSISNLKLWCYSINVAGGVGQEILKVYQENNQLTFLSIISANLQNSNGGDRVTEKLQKSSKGLSKILQYNRCAAIANS